ncbi:MAG TPA: hypothetical protein P5171_06745, partial [Xanthomonadaceae bacterium]|nr:hypothetical protein [Xanthomonadaceae bacterium]
IPPGVTYKEGVALQIGFQATVSLDKQRKVARWPEGTVKALDLHIVVQRELDPRLRGDDRN